jgi:hypothetical protein
MAKRVAFPDLKAAGDIMKPRTFVDWSDEELGMGMSIEEFPIEALRISFIVSRT